MMAVEPRGPCGVAISVDTHLLVKRMRNNAFPLLIKPSLPTTLLSHAYAVVSGSRCNSMSFTSPDVRKARLTYFDAGNKVQVFNAVIYPDPSLNMPLLGIDLISFGGKHLAGIDFQPLFDDEKCRSR